MFIGHSHIFFTVYYYYYYLLLLERSNEARLWIGDREQGDGRTRSADRQAGVRGRVSGPAKPPVAGPRPPSAEGRPPGRKQRSAAPFLRDLPGRTRSDPPVVARGARDPNWVARRTPNPRLRDRLGRRASGQAWPVNPSCVARCGGTTYRWKTRPAACSFIRHH